MQPTCSRLDWLQYNTEEDYNSHRSEEEMLQQGYYDVVQTHSEISSGSESNNNTPFSVKDILNLVDQNAAAAAAAAAEADYLGCTMERYVGKFFL